VQRNGFFQYNKNKKNNEGGLKVYQARSIGFTCRHDISSSLVAERSTWEVEEDGEAEKQKTGGAPAVIAENEEYDGKSSELLTSNEEQMLALFDQAVVCSSPMESISVVKALMIW
jgi:hypothetical protein